MAIVKDPPKDLPTTNALDGIPVEPDSREIRLGQNVLLASDDPPQLGETREIVLRMRCVRRGEEKQSADTDAEITHFCGMKIVTAWPFGKPKPPDADENQPGLYDAAGEVNPDAVDGDDGEDEPPTNEPEADPAPEPEAASNVEPLTPRKPRSSRARKTT